MNQQETLLRLGALRQAGYRYIHTQDDGDTWIGSNRDGLPIDRLLDLKMFLGEVVVDPPGASVPESM
ncbi:MAG: hypothetical protein ACC645_21665 [Pirellulales bacterium]